MTKKEMILDYFIEGAVTSIERLEADNYRITFKDETVSDWRVIFDEEGVLDAIKFNQVI